MQQEENKEEAWSLNVGGAEGISTALKEIMDRPKPENYIKVSLEDYLSVNNGKIKPTREVIFSFYESGISYSRSIFGGGASHWTSCYSETVTRVRKHPKGYSGTNSKGKRIVVEERNASLRFPLSIVKGK